MVTDGIEIQNLVKEGKLTQITDDNYYDMEINKTYMSFHTWLSLHGCDGIIRCEAKSVAEMNGEYEDTEADKSALKIGSYVDSILAGDEEEFNKFQIANPDIFNYEKSVNMDMVEQNHPEWLTRNGTLKSDMSVRKIEAVEPTHIVYKPKGLKAEYVMAQKMVERCQRDPLFMGFMDGEKQKIFTAELWGVPFKCKIDSYKPYGKPIIVDLKTTRDMHKTFFKQDIGHIDFISYYGYIYQLALYREIVYRVTGEMCDCYVCAVSKGKHPEIKVIAIDNISLNSALEEIEKSIKYSPLVDVWRGEIEPTRCESPNCPYCVDTEVLTKVMDYRDLGAMV